MTYGEYLLAEYDKQHPSAPKYDICPDAKLRTNIEDLNKIYNYLYPNNNVVNTYIECLKNGDIGWFYRNKLQELNVSKFKNNLKYLEANICTKIMIKNELVGNQEPLRCLCEDMHKINKVCRFTSKYIQCNECN